MFVNEETNGKSWTGRWLGPRERLEEMGVLLTKAPRARSGRRREQDVAATPCTASFQPGLTSSFLAVIASITDRHFL